MLGHVFVVGGGWYAGGVTGFGGGVTDEVVACLALLSTLGWDAVPVLRRIHQAATT